MRLNPFKKNFAKQEAKKEKDVIFEEVKVQISREISEIEKIADEAERVTRYEALNEKLQSVYSDGKPASADTVVPAATVMGAVGLTAGMIAGACILGPAAVPAVFLGMWGAGAAIGVVGGAGLGGWVDGDRRKELRTKYGSVRNAQAIYKLQKIITKNLNRDRDVIQRSEQKENEPICRREQDEKLRENFKKNYRKGTSADKETSAQKNTSPATHKVLRKQIKP